MACYETTYHAIWLWNFILDLEVVYSISIPLKLFLIIPQLYLSLGTLGALLAPSTLM